MEAEKDSEERLRMEYLFAQPVWEPMIMFDDMMFADMGPRPMMMEMAMAMPEMAMADGAGFGGMEI